MDSFTGKNKPEPEVTDRLPAVRTIAEVLEEGREKSGRPSVVIGTLNIFTAPVRLVTAPLSRRYQERYYGRYRWAKTLFIVDLILLLLVLALLVSDLSFYSASRAALRPTSAVSALTLPERSKIGEPVNLNITVGNTARRSLDQAVLKIKAPEEIKILDSPEAYDHSSGLLQIGELAAGSNQTFSFRILPLLPLASDGSAEGKIFFTLSGSGDGQPVEFVSESRVRLLGSVVTVTLPEISQLVVHERRNLPVVIKNTGSLPLGPLVLRLCGGGAIESSGCREETWPLLGPRQTASSTLTITAGDGDSGDLLAEVIYEPEGKARVISRAREKFAVVDPGAELTLALLAGASPLQKVDSVPLTLTLSRLAAGLILENVKITASAAGGEEKIVGALSSDELNQFIREKQGLLFADLREIKDQSADLAALATVVRADGERVSVRSAVLKVPLPPEVKLLSLARYWSEAGEQLGRGPIPPEVGQKTEYWIFWNIEPLARDLKSVEISAKLPGKVSWTGKQSVGLPNSPAIVYNPATRTVRWRALEIPATIAGEGIGLAFSVELLPAISDRGAEMTLLGESKLSVVTSDLAAAESSAPAVTTRLILDQRAKGKEKVAEGS